QLQLFHEVFGLQDVIESSHLESLDRRLGTGKRGQQNELAAEGGFAKFTEEIDSRHIRHLDVGDDEVEFRCLQLREPFFSAAGTYDNEALFLQEDLEQFTQRTLVVDDKDFGPFLHLF